MNQTSTVTPAERQRRILEIALIERFVRVKDLAHSIGTHEMTIRRDLQELAERGLLERRYGGASLTKQNDDEIAYGLRVAQQTQAKARIARAALDLIQDGDAIGLDASTSALALAQIIALRSVNVVTTGLDAANTLAGKNVPFTLAGGTFHARARSFVGGTVGAALAKFNLDIVFFSAKGFTPEAGFTDAHIPEVEAKEQLIAAGRMVVVLLDHAKFDTKALSRIVRLDQVQIVITNQTPNEATQKALERAKVRLIVTPEETA